MKGEIQQAVPCPGHTTMITLLTHETPWCGLLMGSGTNTAD